MSLITGVDSGAQTGWAQALHGTLTGCGLCHVHADRPLGNVPWSEGGKVYIEYPIHRRQGKTVDPNDLIRQAFRVGRVQETYLVLGNAVTLILPSDWKGGTPKDIQNERDERALTPAERALVLGLLTSVPESLRNNVWDAIGITLWAARRNKERKS